VADLPADLTLELADVRLRRLRADDAAALARLRSDPDVVRWSQPGGCTPAEAAAEIDEAERAWSDGRRAELAIATRGGDELVGAISLTLYGDRRASVGFDVAPDARGRGVATRSTDALCSWAFETWPRLVRIELWALPGNEGTIRVAERTGFRREGVLRSRLPFGDDVRDVVVFSRLRTDPH
jgi:ribosomal-protein-alanine N-acetyltransferase